MRVFLFILALDLLADGAVFAAGEVKSSRVVIDSVNPLEIYEKKMELPYNWGLLLIGADLANEMIQDLRLPRVPVVTSDSSVVKGAREIRYQVTNEHRRLPLLSEINLKRNFAARPDDRAIDIWDWHEFILENFPRVARYLVGAADPIHSGHVAGIIGLDQTEFGVSNLASIGSLDVFRGLSEVMTASLISAYEMLLSRPEPAAVLNISHGIGVNPRIHDALHKLAHERETVCVIASANGGAKLSEGHVFTQLKDDCIIVGSLGPSGIKSSFSNYGNAISLVAPGEFIISLGSDFTYRDRWLSIRSGTSMAAPMVSGVAATLKAILPLARAEDIRSLLYQTAVDLGFTGRDDFTGHGMLNAYRAVWVAKTLLKAKKTSAEDIQVAIKNPLTFKQTEFARQKLISATKLGSTSPRYKHDLREAVLLDGHVTDFLQLGKAYERDRYQKFGMGLQVMAANHAVQEVPSKDLIKYGKHLAKLQEEALKQSPRNDYVLRSLANTSLIRQFERSLPTMDALLLSNPIEAQLNRVASQKVADFAGLSRQKLSLP